MAVFACLLSSYLIGGKMFDLVRMFLPQNFHVFQSWKNMPLLILL